MNSICNSNPTYSISLAHLFSIIVKEHPELMTAVHVDLLFNSMKAALTNSNIHYYILKGLSYAANVKPHLFHQHRVQLLQMITKQRNLSACECLQQYLVASCIVGDENTANESLTILLNILKNSKIDDDIRVATFHTCGLIGAINKQALESKRNDFIKFQSYAECRLLLDFLDGKKMNTENKEAIDKMRKEIVHMETAATKTKDDMTNIEKVVKRQELNVCSLFYQTKNTEFVSNYFCISR